MLRTRHVNVCAKERQSPTWGSCRTQANPQSIKRHSLLVAFGVCGFHTYNHMPGQKETAPCLSCPSGPESAVRGVRGVKNSSCTPTRFRALHGARVALCRGHLLHDRWKQPSESWKMSRRSRRQVQSMRYWVWALRANFSNSDSWGSSGKSTQPHCGLGRTLPLTDGPISVWRPGVWKWRTSKAENDIALGIKPKNKAVGCSPGDSRSYFGFSSRVNSAKTVVGRQI